MKDVLMTTKTNKGIADFGAAVDLVNGMDVCEHCQKIIAIFTDAEGGRGMSPSMFHCKDQEVRL